MNRLGAYVRTLRGDQSLRDFAARCGISHTYLDAIEKGADPRTGQKPRASVELLQRISSGAGIDYLYLAALAGEYEYRPDADASRQATAIPILGTVPAGVPAAAVEEIHGWELITHELARRGSYFGLIIKGSSMEPRFIAGDTVIVRQQEDVESGSVAVVMVGNEEATVKRLLKHDHGISLLPNNPAYSPMFFTWEEVAALPVRVVGKVVELRGRV